MRTNAIWRDHHCTGIAKQINASIAEMNKRNFHSFKRHIMDQQVPTGHGSQYDPGKSFDSVWHDTERSSPQQSARALHPNMATTLLNDMRTHLTQESDQVT